MRVTRALACGCERQNGALQVMLPPVTDGVTYAAVESAYNLAQGTLASYITQVHAAWHASIPAGIAKELDSKLLVASASEGGLLSCNFSKAALTLFQEVCSVDPCDDCVGTIPTTSATTQSPASEEGATVLDCNRSIRWLLALVVALAIPMVGLTIVSVAAGALLRAAAAADPIHRDGDPGAAREVPGAR